MKITINKNKYGILFSVLFLITIFFLIYKAKFGFGYSDEALYIAIPYRFMNGDKIFLNEWNLSQMSALVTYPFVKLAILFAHGTDGIFLYYRYIFICVQSIFCLYFYRNLKKYNNIGAIAYSIFMLLYVPANIMALSYNTCCILLMNTLSIMISISNNRYRYWIAGLCLGLATLCNPFLALMFFYYIVILFKSAKKGENETTDILWFVVGVAVIFFIWLTYTFSKIDINDLLISLKEILEGDTGHTGGLLKKPFTYVLQILLSYKMALFFYIIVLLSIGLSILPQKKFSRVFLGLLCIISISIYYIYFIFTGKLNPNVQSIPIAVLGAYFAIAYRDIINKKYFWYIWFPGLIYSFLQHVASDNGIDSIAMAGTVMILGTILMLGDVVNYESSNIKMYKKLIFTVLIMFFACISALFYVRWNGIFWDTPKKFQTEYISFGPNAGLYTTKEKLEEYKEYYSEMIALDSSKKVLFFTDETWAFLLEGYENTSFSPWVWRVTESTVERYMTYYSINPEKRPDLIYLSSEYTYVGYMWLNYGYDILEQTNSGGYVLKAL